MPDLLHFYGQTCSARKILAVDLGFLGDTVHLVPALWELDRAYPKAELHVLATPVGGEVLRMVPCVERVWPLELQTGKKTWREHWQLVSALRRERFDLVVNFSGADRTIFLTALAGTRWRVSHEGGRRHFWNPWLIPNWVPRRDPELPAYEQRRQVLAACGLKLAPPRWDLRIPAEAAARAATLFPKNAIHFSISASTPFKEWPLEHWIELANRLLSREPQLQIVATGSTLPREQERLQFLAAGVVNKQLAILPGGLSIAELAAGLQRCRLHVGADSGVLHLAVAAGVPTVSLFRDYRDAGAWMPVGPNHRVLKVPCQCVNQPNPPCAPSGRAECLARLEPAQVEAAVRDLLGRLSS